MDENPYQSPQSDAAPLPERQRGPAPLVVRVFLSGWTGVAITLLMLAGAFMTVNVQSRISLVFIGLGLAILWFAAHGVAAVVWR